MVKNLVRIRMTEHVDGSSRFHRPVEGEEGYEPFDNEKDLSSLAQIVSSLKIAWVFAKAGRIENCADSALFPLWRSTTTWPHTFPRLFPRFISRPAIPQHLDSGKTVSAICRGLRNRPAQFSQRRCCREAEGRG